MTPAGWARLLPVGAALVGLAAAAAFSVRAGWADYSMRQETVDSTRRAIALMPDQSEYHARLAFLAANNDPRTARDALRRAVALNPWDARSWIELGLSAEAESDDATAIQCLLRAAEVDQEFLPRWTLANYYFRHNDVAMFWYWTRQAVPMVYGDATAMFRLCGKVEEDGRLISRLEIRNPDVRAGYLSYLFDQNRVDLIGPCPAISVAPAEARGGCAPAVVRLRAPSRRAPRGPGHRNLGPPGRRREHPLPHETPHARMNLLERRRRICHPIPGHGPRRSAFGVPPDRCRVTATGQLGIERRAPTPRRIGSGPDDDMQSRRTVLADHDPRDVRREEGCGLAKLVPQRHQLGYGDMTMLEREDLIRALVAPQADPSSTVGGERQLGTVLECLFRGHQVGVGHIESSQPPERITNERAARRLLRGEGQMLELAATTLVPGIVGTPRLYSVGTSFEDLPESRPREAAMIAY